MSNFTSDSWAVVQNAGFANEKVISTWSSYDDAMCAMMEHYTWEELDELNVDVMKWDAEQGDWSTEY